MGDSAWAAVLKERQTRLFSRLVTSLTQLAPGEESGNYELALEFVQGHARRHSFVDTDPWEVDKLYSSLEGACERVPRQSAARGAQAPPARACTALTPRSRRAFRLRGAAGKAGRAELSA